MKQFLDRDFLLSNEVSKKLFFEHAEKLPIIDYHCHLSPKEIYEDKKFNTITEVWLGSNGVGDHYKWRLMREMGIDESYITGDKPDYERFFKFAEAMPYFLGNPMYHWCHLELQRFFGITKTLSASTAKEIYDEANKKLETLTARKLIEMSNVYMVGTTDDPVDDLHYHELLAKDKSFKTRVIPCLRPDKAMNIERKTFLPWLTQMEKVCNRKITSLQDLLDSLDERVKYFVDHGCVAADHGLDSLYFRRATYEEANEVFLKGLKGEEITIDDQDVYKGYILVHMGRLYHKYGLVQQYHIGAIRNNSKRMFEKLGPDTGYDSIGDDPVAAKLADLLSTLEETNELPKTILYTLNPRDNEVLAGMMNCFQGEGIKGKIQFGTAWWFNDHYDGMNRQLSCLASEGLLSVFVGMLTDSRSFLSYPRHEYFRRILCDFIGRLVENGQYPCDYEILGKIVEDICFNNAYHYFNLDK